MKIKCFHDCQFGLFASSPFRFFLNFNVQSIDFKRFIMVDFKRFIMVKKCITTGQREQANKFLQHSLHARLRVHNF